MYLSHKNLNLKSLFIIYNVKILVSILDIKFFNMQIKEKMSVMKSMNSDLNQITIFK